MGISVLSTYIADSSLKYKNVLQRLDDNRLESSIFQNFHKRKQIFAKITPIQL